MESPSPAPAFGSSSPSPSYLSCLPSLSPKLFSSMSPSPSPSLSHVLSLHLRFLFVFSVSVSVFFPLSFLAVSVPPSLPVRVWMFAYVALYAHTEVSGYTYRGVGALVSRRISVYFSVRISVYLAPRGGGFLGFTADNVTGVMCRFKAPRRCGDIDRLCVYDRDDPHSWNAGFRNGPQLKLLREGKRFSTVKISPISI